MINPIILQTPAFFWDGSKKLPGKLTLSPNQLIFHFEDFSHSHLNLQILLPEIEYVKVFMVFNIAKNGLKVCSRDGKVDLFVLEEAKAFCSAVLREMGRSPHLEL